MDIGKFNEMFRDAELCDVLWPNRATATEIEQEMLIDNLFAVSDDQKARFIGLFIESIAYDRANDIHKGTCGKLEKKFEKSLKKLRGDVKETIEKVVISARETKIAKSSAHESKSNRKESTSSASADSSSSSSASSSSASSSSTSATASSSSMQFGRFADQWFPLSRFKERAEVLRKDNSQAKAIMMQVKAHTESDPAVSQLSTLDAQKPENRDTASSHNAPFDFNRSGRDIEGAFNNASDVQLGNRRNYLLSACPRDSREAGSLFDTAIRQGVSVFVSLIEANEASSRCNNFWTPEKLAQITLRDGWSITQTARRVLLESARESRGTRTPQLIETSLVASKSGSVDRALTHLHYDAWRDRQPAPNDDLIQALLDRVEELQGASDAPFEINCKGGVGRTGTVAVCHYLRQMIDAELARGVALDEIRINVPEVIYAFRKQRSGLVSKEGPQLAQIYSVMGAYYEQLKTQQALVEQATALGNPAVGGGKMMDLIFAYARGATVTQGLTEPAAVSSSAAS